MKLTDNVWPVPMLSTVPAGGRYANTPATLAVAVNCGAPSAVPYVMAAGFAQLMTGVAPATVSVPLAVLWYEPSVTVAATAYVPAPTGAVGLGPYTVPPEPV